MIQRLLLIFSAILMIQGCGKPNPQVRITTNMGAIELELFINKSPETVANFLKYVDDGFYNGTIFHRAIPGFMIQGGGFEPGLVLKPAPQTIKNEADNGIKNEAGTVAMARTPDPHSASSQFFINTVDNAFLNHRDRTPDDWGYAVFGRVTQGMDVVRTIARVTTTAVTIHEHVPVKDVVIEKIEQISTKK